MQYLSGISQRLYLLMGKRPVFWVHKTQFLQAHSFLGSKKQLAFCVGTICPVQQHMGRYQVIKPVILLMSSFLLDLRIIRDLFERQGYFFHFSSLLHLQHLQFKYKHNICSCQATYIWCEVFRVYQRHEQLHITSLSKIVFFTAHLMTGKNTDSMHKQAAAASI